MSQVPAELHGPPPDAPFAVIPDRALPVLLSAMLLCVVSIAMMIAIPCNLYADFHSYEIIVQELRAQSLGEVLVFEPFSRLFLLLCSKLNNNPTHVATIGTYINLSIYLCAMTPISIRYATSWRNVLLLGALFSPLLAFVTLRATPAYLLVAFAYLERSARPRRAALAALLAVGFHISAAVPLIPFALTSDNRFGRIFSGPQTRRLDVWIVCAGALLYLTWGGLAAYLPGLATFLQGQGEFAKFAVYAAQQGETSLMHHVYFVMVLGVMILLLIWRDFFSTRDVRYMTLSFLGYCAMAVSPVVAFRESIYWMIPLILVLPLHRYVRTSVVSFVFCVLCVILYAVDFHGVLI